MARHDRAPCPRRTPRMPVTGAERQVAAVDAHRWPVPRRGTPATRSSRIAAGGSSLSSGLKDRAADECLEQRQLVGVLGQRRGAVECGAPACAAARFVDPFSRQRGFGRLGPVRHRRCRAEDDRGAFAGAVRVKIESDGHIGERPVEGILFRPASYEPCARSAAVLAGGSPSGSLAALNRSRAGDHGRAERKNPPSGSWRVAPAASVSSIVASKATSAVAAVEG